MELDETRNYGEFIIRKSYLAEADIIPMVQLLRNIYSASASKINEHYVRWKYLGYPEGKTILYQALTRQGQMVATRSAAPSTMLIADSEVKTFFNIDAGTLPEYRKNNLYSVLQQQHMEDNGQNTFILTYPAYEGVAYNTYINKLNWHLLSKVKMMCLPYSRLRPLWKKAFHFTKNPPISLRKVTRFGENTDLYFNQKKNYNVPIVKKYSAAILNWLTIDSGAYNNFKLYEIYESEQCIGILITLKRQTNQVEILKVDFNYDDYYTQYIPFIIDYITSNEQARLIYIWETRNPPLRAALEKAGFIINYSDLNKFGHHFFPALIYSSIRQINGVYIYDAHNFELDIFTRDFV